MLSFINVNTPNPLSMKINLLLPEETAVVLPKRSFAFLDKCAKDKIKVDNLYVISDMQIGDGESVAWEKSSSYGYGKFAELLKGFKKVNPNCKIVSISIQGYGSEMFYRGSNILNIAGWSESIFDVINSKFCGYKNMIEEIKKIKYNH